jgi:hypothetical protein
VVSCPASRQESKGARSGALILSVRHKYLYYLIIINQFSTISAFLALVRYVNHWFTGSRGIM